MADYWKSQPRHYCEFCRCWIADNKPSKDFHENGKKHKLNVQKKLSELRKKGIEDDATAQQKDNYLKQMERGALKKCNEDLKKDPSMAEKYGVKLKTMGPEARPKDYVEQNDSEDSSDSQEKIGASEDQPLSAQGAPKSLNTQAAPQWQTLQSPEGYPYFWNTETNEVRWTPPEEEVPTPKDDVIKNKPPVKQKQKPVRQKQKPSPKPPTAPAMETRVTESKAPLTEQPEIQKPPEPDSMPALPDLSSIPLPQDIPLPPPPTTEQQLVVRSAQKRPADRAYGQWETTQQEEAPEVDFQLPVSEDNTEIATITFTNEPKMKFREKTVDKLSQGLAEFRKRKKMDRNIRKDHSDS